MFPTQVNDSFIVLFKVFFSYCSSTDILLSAETVPHSPTGIILVSSNGIDGPSITLILFSSI